MIHDRLFEGLVSSMVIYLPGRGVIMLSLAVMLWQGCASGHPGRRFRLPDELKEVSGLYYAGPDSLWWHNDSGDEARLFLTDSTGGLRGILPVPGAENVDWEDLTADDEGNLYVGDFGNNANRRRRLRIYRYQPESGRLDSILYTYPDQREFPPPPERANFDMEAFFWYRDSLHLFSKNRLQKGDYYTKHYVLPAAPGHYVADLRDSLYLKKRVVTGAAVSPDGRRITLLTYWYKLILGIIPVTRTTVFWLEDFPEHEFLRGTLKGQKVPKGLAPTQYEAIDFIGAGNVMAASEKTVFFRQQARRLQLKAGRRTVVP